MIDHRRKQEDAHFRRAVRSREGRPVLVLRRGEFDLLLPHPLEEHADPVDFDLIEDERGQGGILSDGTKIYVREDGSAEVLPPIESGRYPRMITQSRAERLEAHERATIEALREKFGAKTIA